MEKERMTQAEQAVLLWPMVALAARTQQILSYAAFEGYTGIAIFVADHRVYSLTGNKMLSDFPQATAIMQYR